MIEDDLSTPAPKLRQEIKRLRGLVPAALGQFDADAARSEAIAAMSRHLCGPDDGRSFACACTGRCIARAEKIMTELEPEGLAVVRVGSGQKDASP
jgi:hypothetical protein